MFRALTEILGGRARNCEWNGTVWLTNAEFLSVTVFTHGAGVDHPLELCEAIAGMFVLMVAVV